MSGLTELQDRMEKKVIGVKHILRVCTEAHYADHARTSKQCRNPGDMVAISKKEAFSKCQYDRVYCKSDYVLNSAFVASDMLRGSHAIRPAPAYKPGNPGRTRESTSGRCRYRRTPSLPLSVHLLFAFAGEQAAFYRFSVGNSGRIPRRALTCLS